MKDINPVEEIKNIMGYGTIIETLEGIYESDVDGHKKGEPKIIQIHITPASLEKIPALYQQINKVIDNPDYTTDIAMTEAATLIKMATEKMHPDFTIEYIKKIFNLVGLAKAIRVVVDVNDFLSEMRETTELMDKANQLKK